MYRVYEEEGTHIIDIVKFKQYLSQKYGRSVSFIEVLRHILDDAVLEGIVAICRDYAYITCMVSMLPDLWRSRCNIYVRIGNKWYKIVSIRPLILKPTRYKANIYKCIRRSDT